VAAAGDVNRDGYDDILVGAPYDRVSIDREGVAYLFYGSPGGLSTIPDWTYGSGQQGSRFGAAVGSAGDINDDGYDDVIIGAYEYKQVDGGKVGAVFVFYGSEGGLRDDTHDWMFLGVQKDAELGISVGSAGDVDGDDHDDIVVGARWYNVVQPSEGSEGRVFVFLGAESGLASAPDWTTDGSQTHAGFGASVGTAGDVNGDGYDDIIVGAPLYDNEGTAEMDTGAAFAFYGSSGGLASTPDWTRVGDQAEAEFGTSVGTAGDINDNGYPEVIIGAPHYSQDDDEGAAFLFYGSGDGLSETPNWTATGQQTGSLFGAAVGTVGDMNADGYDDVIVGAPRYSNDQSLEGIALVFHGCPAGLHATARWSAEGDKADTEFGFWVATAADVQNDGYSDALVGAPNYRHETDLRGWAFAYHGAALTVPVFSVYLPRVMRPPSRNASDGSTRQPGHWAAHLEGR
jgi:hypothetical protein